MVEAQELKIIHSWFTYRDMRDNKDGLYNYENDIKTNLEDIIHFFKIDNVDNWLDFSYKDFLDNDCNFKKPDEICQSHKYDDVCDEKEREYEFYHRCKYRNFNLFMVQYWLYQLALYYYRSHLLASNVEIINEYNVLYYNCNDIENVYKYGILKRPIRLSLNTDGVPINITKMKEDNMGTPIRLFKISETEFETLEEIPSYYIMNSKEEYKIEEPYASEMLQRLKESKDLKEEPKKFNYEAVWKE